MEMRFDMRMGPEFNGYINAIRDMLQQRDEAEGRGHKVTRADAVRYAIFSTYERMNGRATNDQR